MIAVSVRKLRKSFGTGFSLYIEELVVNRGTVVGLVGPNGSGKSTVVHVCTGILPPCEGTIELCGINLGQEPVAAKAIMGVVPEGLGLFDQLRGREHLHFVGRIYGLGREEVAQRATDLFTILEFEDSADKFIHTYSSGTKRKLAFAASIIHQPSLLFLDEPFEGVDPVCAVTMKSILARMNSHGTTVVVTSHNLDLVEKTCSEVAILSCGRIVFRSAMGDVRQRVKDAVTQETYASLEEIFLDIMSNNGREMRRETPSWI